MFYRVWLKGKETEAREIQIILDLDRRVFPMDIRGFLCKNGVFEYGDYTKIRFYKLNNRAQRRMKFKP